MTLLLFPPPVLGLDAVTLLLRETGLPLLSQVLVSLLFWVLLPCSLPASPPCHFVIQFPKTTLHVSAVSSAQPVLSYSGSVVFWNLSPMFLAPGWSPWHSGHFRMDILGWMEFPGHYRMFSSIPDLCWWDAGSTHLVLASKYISRHCILPLVKNHCLLWIQHHQHKTCLWSSPSSSPTKRWVDQMSWDSHMTFCMIKGKLTSGWNQDHQILRVRRDSGLWAQVC